MASNIIQSKRRVYVGDGAPGNDFLTTNIGHHPLDTVYIDRDTRSVYVRTGVNGTSDDWETSEGGGDSGLASNTVTSNDAEIKTLPSTEVELFTAPGVGKMRLITHMVFKFDVTAGVYTNLNILGWVLKYGSSEITMTLPNTGYFEDDSNVWIITVYPDLSSETGQNISLYENQNLNIAIDNGGAGNFTGGNAANTLKVTTYYVDVDL